VCASKETSPTTTPFVLTTDSFKSFPAKVFVRGRPWRWKFGWMARLICAGRTLSALSGNCQETRTTSSIAAGDPGALKPTQDLAPAGSPIPWRIYPGGRNQALFKPLPMRKPISWTDVLGMTRPRSPLESNRRASGQCVLSKTGRKLKTRRNPEVGTFDEFSRAGSQRPTPLSTSQHQRAKTQRHHQRRRQHLMQFLFVLNLCNFYLLATRTKKYLTSDGARVYHRS